MLRELHPDATSDAAASEAVDSMRERLGLDEQAHAALLAKLQALLSRDRGSALAEGEMSTLREVRRLRGIEAARASTLASLLSCILTRPWPRASPPQRLHSPVLPPPSLRAAGLSCCHLHSKAPPRLLTLRGTATKELPPLQREMTLLTGLLFPCCAC